MPRVMSVARMRGMLGFGAPVRRRRFTNARVVRRFRRASPRRLIRRRVGGRFRNVARFNRVSRQFRVVQRFRSMGRGLAIRGLRRLQSPLMTRARALMGRR